MTTTPTPETWIKLANEVDSLPDYIKSVYHPHALTKIIREAATACASLIAERDHLLRGSPETALDLRKLRDERDAARIHRDQAIALYLKLEAERDQALARLAACEIVEANYQEALGEAKKLKAQLDVAVEALEGMANPTHPIGEMYWEWACAALAKIKETP